MGSCEPSRRTKKFRSRFGDKMSARPERQNDLQERINFVFRKRQNVSNATFAKGERLSGTFVLFLFHCPTPFGIGLIIIPDVMM